MSKVSSFRTGFTLIELLIVVAIIGILAAIAIPNFLEAQTRAKVARASEELRTIATAMEQYNLDWQVYPADYFPYMNCPAIFPPLADPWDIRVLLHGLSTPVEYLSNLPYEDPFGEPAASTANGYYVYVNDAEQPYWATGCGTGNVQRYRFISKPHMVGFPARFYWYLKSTGPDKSHEWWGTWEQLYNPTNGTISSGEIARAGP